MRTQSKNKLFGILIALVLVASVFLTLTPIALADEPPAEVMPISEEVPVPVLYDESAEPEAISEELPEPVLYDEQAEPEAISEELPEPVLYEEELEAQPIAVDEPQPELISEQEQAEAKPLPTWGWVMIMFGIAALSALVTFSVVSRKRKKATS